MRNIKKSQSTENTAPVMAIPVPVYESLESFPLWIESRKLLTVIRQCRIAGMDAEDRLFRQTPASRAEAVFFQASDIYERYCAGRTYPGMEHCLEELSKFKTAVYMLFDTGKISNDGLASVLMQSGKVRKILLELNEDTKKRRESAGRRPAPGMPDDMDDEDLPACNKLPPERKPRKKQDEDESEQ